LGVAGVAATVAAVMAVSDARAFPHVVRSGETVAQIAERMYGRVELERVVVAANGLGGGRGSRLVAGQRLEIPAVGYHKVLPGETWQAIAKQALGAEKRGEVLARVNDSQPWLRPEVGREIVLPYNLRLVASRGDSTQSVAYRFLERRDDAWVIASYNRLDRARLRQGEVVLVPLTELELTDAGRQAALNAGALIRAEAGGLARQAQRRAQGELPRLALDVRRGRYIEAVARGAGLLAQPALSEPQLAETHRWLTEAYVALEARGLAATSCMAWRRHDAEAVLDPIELSPKIIDVCVVDAKVEAGIVVGDGGVAQ
jgi:LysM domain